jgi:hypothetical protein
MFFSCVSPYARRMSPTQEEFAGASPSLSLAAPANEGYCRWRD